MLVRIIVGGTLVAACHHAPTSMSGDAMRDDDARAVDGAFFDAPLPRPGACDPALPPPVADSLTAHVKGATCGPLGYYEYVPPGYAAGHDWPLLIAFHGDGQRGNGTTDLPQNLSDGLPQIIQSGGTWDPAKRFVVLAPQMDDRNGLTDRTAPTVKAFIEFAIANYDVDVHRVYLTGFSGGAEPIYNYMGPEHGALVAAVLPISGWYSTQQQECNWAEVPIWYFHGATDNVVPPAQHSTLSYDAMAACPPAVAPRYTLFAARGHDDWQLVYNLQAMSAATYPVVTTPPGTTPYAISMYDWLLQYTRPPA